MKTNEVLFSLAHLRRTGPTKALLAKYQERYMGRTSRHPDEEGYFPFIEKARNGDLSAIRSLTEWKNAAADQRWLDRALFDAGKDVVAGVEWRCRRAKRC
jgi:hypothetical protein